MKRESKVHELRASRLMLATVFTLALVLSLSLFTGWFSIVSHAESAGRVISPEGARVRNSASSGADVLASYAQDTTISIRSQINASDGYVWYEVWMDADKLGYIRSDLVEITDGSTPPESTQVTPTNQQPADNTQPADTNPGGSETPADVAKVNPVSATVKGGDNVRIRNNASTSESSQIVTTVQSGVALTVIGQTTGTDGKLWYQVSFSSNGSDVTGFIRSDFVDLSEDLTPYTEPETVPEPVEDGTGMDASPAEEKPYETVFYDGEWKFLITETGESYSVEAMLNTVSGNGEAMAKLEKSKHGQTIAIIILVILLVGVGGAAAYLVFKLKDIEDAAYFSQVEKETLRRRNQPGQKTMHNVGAEKRSAGQGQRPAGARPAGQGQGQRSSGAGQGQRPAGTSQSQRPSGASQGQRPSGASQGQRPAGTSQSQRPSGAPQGQRPTGSDHGQNPSGASQSQRPTGSNHGQHPSGTPQNQRSSGQSQTRPQPKNFMTTEDEDEFEFEFLNYESEDEQ